MHMPYFGATGTLFWICSDVFLGFQSQSGFLMYIYRDTAIIV